MPTNISFQPQAQAGETVTFTVSGTSVPGTVSTIGVSTTVPAAYSSLPSSVAVPDGATQVQFQATFASDYSGNADCTATGDGTPCTCHLHIPPPDGGQ